MKRQLILSIILLVLVFAAFGVYYFVDIYQQQQEKKKAEEAAALQLTTLSSSDVIKLDLHTPELDYTVEPDDSGDWIVTNADDIHINTYYITALCTYGCSLTASKDLGSVDKDTLESYELTDPISITYYTESGESTLYIGAMTPTGEYFYIMTEENDHVFLVDADTAGYLYVTQTQLRYRYVMEDKESDICEVSLISGGNVVYHLTETEDLDWEMDEPFDVPLEIDKSNLNSLFITLIQLEIDDFGDSDLTEEDYDKYGFDDPAYIFQFVQETGETTTLYFEEYDPLTVSYVNCLRVETGEILIFDSSYISFLQKETSDYLLSTLYKPGIDDTAEVTLQYSGSFNDTTLDIDLTMELDTENSVYVWNGITFTEDDTDIVSAIRNFFSLAANLSYESIQMDGELPENTEPSLQLEYTLTDGESHTVELYPNNDTTYWAVIDGEFTYALVRQKQLSGNNKLLEEYTDLVELIESTET